MSEPRKSTRTTKGSSSTRRFRRATVRLANRKVKAVMCATDLSVAASHALAVAAEIAQAFEAKLLVFHAVEAWDNRYDFLMKDLQQALTKEARERVESELHHLGASEAVPIEVVIRKGRSVPTILKAIEEFEPGLLVVGSQGGGEPEESSLGSVAEHLLQASPVSVLIARPSLAPDIKHIVCAMDFSPCSITGLDWAIDLAERERIREISVVNAIKVPTGYLGAGMTYESALNKMKKIHQADFAKVCTRRRTAKIKLDSVIREGPTAETIVKVAEEKKAELIVIGTRGRSKLTAIIVGSVAIKVVRKAKVSVLAVKAGKHQLTLLAALGEI